MFCSGLSWGSLAALVGNTHFFWYDEDRRSALFEGQLLAKLVQFRGRVMRGDPPEMITGDADIVRAMYPNDTGETVDVPSARAHFDVWQAAKKRLKEAERDESMARAQMILDIGEASFLHANGDPLVSYKTQLRKGRLTVDTDHIHRLITAGIPYKTTESANVRVMRVITNSIAGGDES